MSIEKLITKFFAMAKQWLLLKNTTLIFSKKINLIMLFQSIKKFQQIHKCAKLCLLLLSLNTEHLIWSNFQAPLIHKQS